jgi:hypothetical protein
MNKNEDDRLGLPTTEVIPSNCKNKPRVQVPFVGGIAREARVVVGNSFREAKLL